MLAHPLHLRLLSANDCQITILEDFKYNSIDGELVGVVGDSWVLKTDPISITWHSIKGIKEESYPEIIDALCKDVKAMNSTTTSATSSYSHGKMISRVARLALIAEEVCYLEEMPTIRKYLKDKIEPWLDGTFDENGFLYDKKWGGIVTKQGSLDSGADFGFGTYNNHHYHLSYFLYAIAVLAKIDPAWGRKYRPRAYSLMADFMNLGQQANSNYPQLRCFDLWKLHSWAGGLTEFADGRHQESSSQAVNAYYSAALMGLAYGDTHLVAIGSTLSAMEIQSAKTWWHVREGDKMYAEDFTKENKMVGVLWANKRDSSLWFAPPAWRECRLGIQLLPLSPITEVLFSDVGFVRELVQWTLPALEREGVEDGWKGFVYALEAIYDKVGALDKIKNLNGFDDGNSLTNLLWWIHSRRGEEGQEKEWGGKFSWRSPSTSPRRSPSPPLRRSPLPPTYPFLFPQTQSSVLPDPSLFSSHLLPSPLPTNSFFQNFVLKDGDQPEYIHPYLIKSSLSSLSICYPSQLSNRTFTTQIFNADLTISISNNSNPNPTHIISSYTDLSVTLEFPSSNLKFFLVRGSPFLTCAVTGDISFSISTVHAIHQLSSNSSLTRYTINLSNNQTWILYSSSPVNLTHENSTITSEGFSGIIRIAFLPDSSPRYETILNRFSSGYPVSGDAMFRKPYCLEYKWEKKGWGDLLMLAHPLHLRLLSTNDCQIIVLEDFKYQSIDGELVGVVGDSWVLKTNPVSVTWHSIRGIKKRSYSNIIDALCNDVQALNSTTISTTSSYSHGKLIARAARLALIAEEVCYPEVIPEILKYLKEKIEPWLDGTFDENGFLYDNKWGGIVTKQGSLDSGADFGFGIYNDHHYHLGYFLYAIAVLAKTDPAWGRNYRPQAYSLMADFMNLGRQVNSNYPQLRCFDLWKLHSWAGGLTEFADGRHQESTSQAVNAYYSAALMGLAYGDTDLIAIGSTLMAMEIQSAQTWWHVRDGDKMYAKKFTRKNRMVGVLWANKRDSGLSFAPPEWRECRLGIQLLPLLPITEVLFADVGFVKELVQWTLPSLERKSVGEGWKGFVYALEAIYDKVSAFDKIKNLTGFDEGNSLTNLLWWIHSRGNEEDQGKEWGGKFCWFDLYYH
ncbi:hypothetical protein F0562_004267 [Nyssa sinensis]|uniref:glucan endo-1,3-beta-D-glucosidase n=1 Tax=Nyssa sinensis TaxID=561372 RepID=A0A5J5BY21_9ASTE|nr:hypothetical protein F0562_004267 [Nyssa sinensis]